MVDASHDASEVRSKVREFLTQQIVLDAQDLDDETPLLNGLVDSVGLMELVTFIEGEFSLEIDFSEVEPKNFRTVSDIARFVSDKLAAA
jgi:acyl carrier protein